MRDTLLVLYNIPWQRLRVSTLKKYQHPALGGWTTLEGTEANIKNLNEYLENASSDEEKYVRSWRILNMLDAIRMGHHGQQTQLTPPDERVVKYAAVIRNLHRKLKSRYGPITLQTAGSASFEAFEKTIRRQLSIIPKDDRLLLGVYYNLRDRQKKHSDRAELNWFLELLTDEVEWLPIT